MLIFFSPLLEDLRYETGVYNPRRTEDDWVKSNINHVEFFSPLKEDLRYETGVYNPRRTEDDWWKGNINHVVFFSWLIFL